MPPKQTDGRDTTRPRVLISSGRIAHTYTLEKVRTVAQKNYIRQTCEIWTLRVCDDPRDLSFSRPVGRRSAAADKAENDELHCFVQETKWLMVTEFERKAFRMSTKIVRPEAVNSVVEKRLKPCNN